MTEENNPQEEAIPLIVDPKSFAGLFGADAAFAIIVSKSGEAEQLAVPEGTEYEPASLPAEVHTIQARRCYCKRSGGKLYYCCRGWCFRVDRCPV